MKKFNNYIIESADFIYKDRILNRNKNISKDLDILQYTDSDSIGFLYLNSNNRFYTFGNTTHTNYIHEILNMDDVRSDLEEDYPNYSEEEIDELVEDITASEYMYLGGRIWYLEKVIGFWENVTKIELLDVVSDLNNDPMVSSKCKIDGSWKIHIDEENQFIKLDEYTENILTDKNSEILKLQQKLHYVRGKEREDAIKRLSRLGAVEDKPKSKKSAWKKWMKPFENFNIQL